MYYIFVVMTYSAGAPIFYVLAAMHFASTYWIEKYELLRVCKVGTAHSTPPRRGGKGRPGHVHSKHSTQHIAPCHAEESSGGGRGAGVRGMRACGRPCSSKPHVLLTHRPTAAL